MRASARAGAGAQGLSRGRLPSEWSGGAARREARRCQAPPRPSLTPLLLCLAGAWAAVLASGRALVAAGSGALWCGLDPRAAFAACASAAAAALAIAAARAPAVRAACALAAVGVACGSCAGALAAAATLADGARTAALAPSSLELVVETDPRMSSSGAWSFEASCGGARARVEAAPGLASGRDGWEALPGMGRRVRVAGRWRALGADGFDASLIQRGVCARLTAYSVEDLGPQEGPVGAVRAFRARVLESVGPYRDERRALVAGVVCGMQAALAGFPASDDFAALGLSHLVAVSGSHLAVVAGAWGALMRGLRARPGASLGATSALLAAYVAFTGFQPSAARAWAMAVLALGARVAGRRSHAVSAVALAALCMVLADPSCAASVGFSLSVLSVLGISVFAGLAGAWAGCLLPSRFPRAARDAMALTLVAQAFTAPVALPLFGTASPASPLANALAGPLVSALLAAGLALAPLAAALPPAASALLAPLDLLAGAAVASARAVAGLPLSCLAVDAGALPLAAALAAGSACLYALWPEASRARAACALAACGAAVAAALAWWGLLAPARVVVLDVGQGDAILIQDGRHAMLVDTGPGTAVRSALARQHVLGLDLVLLTHTDSDHAGGLAAVAGCARVGEVVLAEGVAEALAEDDPELLALVERASSGRVRSVSAGEEMRVGRFLVTVLWPRASVDGADNEDSVVALAVFDDGSRSMAALLTGDAEAGVVEPLALGGAAGQVDLLKAGHHGSKASTSEAMVAALDPLLTVASAGEGNSYGHPSRECVEAAVSAGGEFLCTADAGDVDVRPAADGVEVRASAPAEAGPG